MQRYPLQPQMPPSAGYHPQRGFKEQEEHPWRDEGCSRHTSGDGPSPLEHLHTIPLSMNLLSGFLSSSPTANRRPGVPGVTADGWPEPGLDQTGLGAEELGADGRETRSGTDMREAQADGKNKVLEGPRAFFSQTHLFPCVQDKVTRYMIYLALRKQLFGGSVGVFRQSCSVSEESHLQMLTASFYPLPLVSLQLSPHQAVLHGCFRLSLSLYFWLHFNSLKLSGLPGFEGHPTTFI